MIKSAGNRISPQEIEEVALALDGVAEAVAIGVPDERLGQAVRLFVRASPGRDGTALTEQVREAIRRDLPNFMMPRDIEVVDALPRNPNGKIDRAALVNEVAA